MEKYKKIEIYCDESRPDLFTTSQDKKDKYVLIGGLKLPFEKRELIKDDLKSLKEKHNIKSEIKWKKVGFSKIDFYKELVDLFFKHNDYLRFRCVAVDYRKVDFEKYHANDKELGFYKFYYQLFNHWVYENNSYSIFLDCKTNRINNRLNKLSEFLKKSNPYTEIDRVQALPSNEVILIQFADFLTGITSSSLNKSLTKTNGAKKTIIDYFEKLLGKDINHTNRSEKKFNVFIIDLEGSW